jgi:hypothetical protein
MRDYDIYAYAFNGALFHTYCLDNPSNCTCGELDENGLCLNNCHGYGPNPCFTTDFEEGYTCDSCGEEIEL